MSEQYLELMSCGPEIPVEAAVGSDIGIVAVVYEMLDGDFSTFFRLIQLHELLKWCWHLCYTPCMRKMAVGSVDRGGYCCGRLHLVT